jgi:sarcosine oxidase subunit beta
MLGDTAPVTPTALMMMVSERMPHFVDPTVGAMGRKLSFKQMQTGTVVIGGGFEGWVDRTSELTELDFRQLAQSAANAAAIFPIMAGARLVRCWAGIEGVTQDDLPYIGPSKAAPAAYHSFAFCGHGFQLGPIVGSITAELIVNGRTNLPIEPFRIDRFSAAG